MENIELKQVQNNAALNDIVNYFRRVRYDSEIICEPLEIEDFGIQTMPEVSPPKWHLAHTSWFFEIMVLKPFYKNYKEYNTKFSLLFNSYYGTIGNYYPRSLRGTLSRPTVKEVYQYRRYIDRKMLSLLTQEPQGREPEILTRTILGLNHEQQHQELLFTDIKHIFASNPLRPVYRERLSHDNIAVVETENRDINWIDIDGGVNSIGFSNDGFTYDNETPEHKVYINNFQLASRPVSNGEYLEFMNAGGYQQVSLWLSDAWKMVTQHQWQAPLYWEEIDNSWYYMTLNGMKAIDMTAPVCHVSYFEASAYARWYSEQETGVRLVTEAEWEIAACNCSIEGNFRDSNVFQSQVSQLKSEEPILHQMYGDVWEWTQSAYSAYPGFFAEKGALGEYNGKFMNGQIVLRGGSCVTAIDHIRPSYRNFFYPHERWQFSGFRLAKDIV